MPKERKLQSIELFAGAGGLGMGVSLAGFKPLQVVEWDADCCRTLADNVLRKVKPLQDWKISQVDVRELSFLSFEDKIDLLTGGPPCQPFSLGGRHAAYRDERDMFPQAVRAVREIRPKAFLFENVKGLTRPSFGNYLEYIRLQLIHPETVIKDEETWTEHLGRLEDHELHGKSKTLNYNVIVHVANAADYGIPQKRERVFFVGFRSDIPTSWHFPFPTHSAESLAWSQYRCDEYWDKHRIGWRKRAFSEKMRAKAWKCQVRPNLLPWTSVRDAIGDLPAPYLKTKVKNMFENHVFQQGARAYHGHTGSTIDEPAKTLKAGVHGVPGGENMLQLDNGGVRYFTVRESARLQTFPDEYVFNSSWSESMRQIGNAVPVRLAEIVAKDIRRVLVGRHAN